MMKCSIHQDNIILNVHTLNSFKILKQKMIKLQGEMDILTILVRYFNILSIIDRMVKQKTIKGCKK